MSLSPRNELSSIDTPFSSAVELPWQERLRIA